ncbi:MAG: ArsR family transcriptional regulator [Nitrosopumilus sp.]
MHVVTTSNKLIVYKHICNNQGKTFSQIVKETNIKASTVRFHLEQLEKEDHIKKVKIEKNRYFDFNENQNNQLKFAIENNKLLKDVLTLLERPLTLDEISNQLSISRGVTSKRLGMLIKLKLIRKNTRQSTSFQKI